jgi:hypothetical protein
LKRPIRSWRPSQRVTLTGLASICTQSSLSDNWGLFSSDCCKIPNPRKLISQHSGQHMKLMTALGLLDKC